MRTIGIFGGTFDPVHKGHIQMALSAISCLRLDEIRLVPCHHPPHRDQPRLDSQQRLHLLNLATKDHPSLVVDSIELDRPGPSWAIDTLKALRCELGGQVSIVLLMGADAYGKLTSWRQWEKLPRLAHIGVFLRPGYIMPREGILFESLCMSAGGVPDLHSRPAGLFVVLNQPQVDLSATLIRKQLAAGVIPEGLDPSVRDYIVASRLYGFG